MSPGVRRRRMRRHRQQRRARRSPALVAICAPRQPSFALTVARKRLTPIFLLSTCRRTNQFADALLYRFNVRITYLARARPRRRELDRLE